MSRYGSAHVRSIDFAGEVLTPGMDGYDEAAATVFATGTPDVVVRPGVSGEVATALRYAAEGGLTVSVRSGGHSVSGFSTHTDGMVIDLRRLSRVDVIDRATRRVRIGAGSTWGAVAAALQPHGLGITAGDTNQVGVGGLTLGGGIGWMVRRYGLAIDSLTGADLVTADGRLLHADADHHSDLFWALRGGGGNFGVVVSFDFSAQPVTSVHYGAISYQPDDLPQLIRGWRDLTRASDENLTTTLTLAAIMPGPPAAVTLQCCYAGPDHAAAARALDPFRQLTTVASDDIRAMPYANVLQDAHHPAGVRIEARNTLVPDLSEEFIAAIEELLGGGGVVLTLRGLGGAFSRVPQDATAFAHRDAEAMLVAGLLLPTDPAPGQTEEAQARWAAAAVHGSGAYVNFAGSATGADLAAIYPPATRQRLTAVKRAYDPGNVFRRNHNIRPGHS